MHDVVLAPVRETLVRGVVTTGSVARAVTADSCCVQAAVFCALADLVSVVGELILNVANLIGGPDVRSIPANPFVPVNDSVAACGDG